MNNKRTSERDSWGGEGRGGEGTGQEEALSDTEKTFPSSNLFGGRDGESE